MIAYIAVLLDVAFPFFISKPWILPAVIVGIVAVAVISKAILRRMKKDGKDWDDKLKKQEGEDP